MPGFIKKASDDRGWELQSQQICSFWLHFWTARLWKRAGMGGDLLDMGMRGRWKRACSWSGFFSAGLLNFSECRACDAPLRNLWAAVLCHSSSLVNLTLGGFRELFMCIVCNTGTSCKFVAETSLSDFAGLAQYCSSRSKSQLRKQHSSTIPLCGRRPFDLYGRLK